MLALRSSITSHTRRANSSNVMPIRKPVSDMPAGKPALSCLLAVDLVGPARDQSIEGMTGDREHLDAIESSQFLRG